VQQPESAISAIAQAPATGREGGKKETDATRTAAPHGTELRLHTAQVGPIHADEVSVDVAVVEVLAHLCRKKVGPCPSFVHCCWQQGASTAAGPSNTEIYTEHYARTMWNGANRGIPIAIQTSPVLGAFASLAPYALAHHTHVHRQSHTSHTHRTAQRARSRTGGRRGLHRAGLVGGVELPCGAVAGGQRAVAAHHHPRQHYSALQSAVRCSTQGKANSSNVCYPVTKQVGPEVVLTVQVSVAVSTLAAAAPQ